MNYCASRERLTTLEAVRCFAFLGVLLSHTNFFILNSGRGGVSVFLVLSGFTMTYSYYGKGRISEVSFRQNMIFAFHKMRRLYPLFIVSTLLMWAVSIIYEGETGALSILRLGLNVLLIQEYIPLRDASICGVAWYLCTAVLSYFIFPWILKWMERRCSVRKAVYAIAGAVGLMIVLGMLGATLPNRSWETDSLWTYNLTKWFDYFFPPVRLLDVIVGCNLGYIYLHASHIKNEQKYTLIELAVICINILAMFICTYWNNVLAGNDVEVYSRSWWTHALVFIIGSAGLVYVFAIGEGAISRYLAKSRLILYLARISPYAYLIHMVVFDNLRRGVGYITKYPIVGRIGDLSDPQMKVIIGIPLTILLTEIWIRSERRVRNMLEHS